MDKNNNEDVIKTEIDVENIIKTVGIGICVYQLDNSFTIVWANTAFFQMLGYKEDHFLLQFNTLIQYGKTQSYDFRPMITHFENAYKDGEKSSEYTFLMPLKNHNSIWVKAIGTFVNTNNSEIPMVNISYLNINEQIIEAKEKTNAFQWMLSEYVGNVYISDMDTYELLYLNKNASDTLQVPAEKLIGKMCYEVIQGRDTPCPFCTNSYLKDNETYEWEFDNPNLQRTFIIKNRMIKWKNRRARVELSHDMYSTEYKLAKKDQEREAILKTIPAGMIRMDARDYNTVLWYNDIFLDMIGYTKKQFEEELHSSCTYMHPDDFKRATMMANDMNKTGENVVFEVRAYTRTKEERIWTVTLCYVSGEDSWDGIPSLYSMGLDITMERKKMEKLKHIAQKDALTGIYNRAETEKQIEEYLLENPDKTSALFMIDTDNFKSINDTKGHMIGDMVLAEMAMGMKRIMRESDVVGRIGGDEFIIFMKNILSSKDVENRAKELLYMFSHLFDNDKSPVRITCSIGISLYPKDGDNFKDMYAKADRALYQAKSQGKNNFVIYDYHFFKNMKENNYISYRTTIESEKRYAESSDDLTSYVFRTLYHSKDVDKAVKTVLETVGKQCDVSRAYVFENTEDGLFTSNTYEWCNEGVIPEINNLQNCDYKLYGDYEKLFGEDWIFYCRDIHILKPEQEALFSKQGIHSTLQCAFLNDGVFSGFIGFDECTGLRLWTQEEVSTLSLISQILSIFLQHKKVKKEIHEMYQYKTVLNSLDECIFVIEKGSHVLLYKNTRFNFQYPEYDILDVYIIDSDKIHKMPIIWDNKDAYLCVKE